MLGWRVTTARDGAKTTGRPLVETREPTPSIAKATFEMSAAFAHTHKVQKLNMFRCNRSCSRSVFYSLRSTWSLHRQPSHQTLKPSDAD